MIWWWWWWSREARLGRVVARAPTAGDGNAQNPTLHIHCAPHHTAVHSSIHTTPKSFVHTLHSSTPHTTPWLHHTTLLVKLAQRTPRWTLYTAPQTPAHVVRLDTMPQHKDHTAERHLNSWQRWTLCIAQRREHQLNITQYRAPVAQRWEPLHNTDPHMNIEHDTIQSATWTLYNTDYRAGEEQLATQVGAGWSHQALGEH